MVDIKIEDYQDEQNIFSYEEIIKRRGVYSPVSSDDEFILVLNVDTCLYCNENGDRLSPLVNRFWQNDKFVKANKKVTITLSNESLQTT